MSKARGRSMAGNPACPTQDKRGFRSEDHIRRKLCKNPEAVGMNIYQCECGYWHLGHPKGKSTKYPKGLTP